MNIITRASVKERIHVEQIIRSQPRMHNSDLVDIVTIPVRKCLGLSMDVYKPVGEFKEPLPIILDVHGGGLIAGRKEQNRNLGIQLARRGYIVFIPDYRLVPETDIFGQISDILDALAVIEAKAAEFGGNIENSSLPQTVPVLSWPLWPLLRYTILPRCSRSSAALKGISRKRFRLSA